MYPKTGSTGRALHQAVADVANTVRNADDGANPVENYLAWASEAERSCRTVMRRTDLERLVLTPRYWATLNNPTPSRSVEAAIADEVLARGWDLDVARSTLEQELRHWADPLLRAVVVPDTNLLLHHEKEIDQVDWHKIFSPTAHRKIDIRLVVPMLVVDELDNAKRGNQRTRARVTLKRLWEWFGAATNDHSSRRHELSSRTEATGEVTIELLFDQPGHRRLTRADDELVDRAAALSCLIDERIHFATYDTNAAFRAQAAGLIAHRLTEDPPAASSGEGTSMSEKSAPL